MQQQQSPTSDQAYQTAAEHLWRRLKKKPTKTGDTLLENLDSDQAILLLHAAIRPHAKQFTQVFPFYLFLLLNPVIQLITRIKSDGLQLLVFVLTISLLGVGVWHWRAAGHSRTRVGQLLIQYLPLCRSTRVLPALLDLALWTNTQPTPLLPKTIARLLLLVGDNELALFVKPEHRVLLRQWCANPSLPVEVVSAALLTLGSLRDWETVPIAQKLIATRATVRDAALAFMDTVGP